ncbi:hypothetical protein K431DRAFT_26679 [Polychaeton citri CBS 116435]|uniref:Uncharacterized protein n=1 Tax=Polychaeton citri CBS 116435 TaxID=1314669 RepID=A0A9P4QBM6_9PEZI|nr:hypothetical protein K431DRAFT_26679 [Polychaeton citri CBS 116435]
MAHIHAALDEIVSSQRDDIIQAFCQGFEYSPGAAFDWIDPHGQELPEPTQSAHVGGRVTEPLAPCSSKTCTGTASRKPQSCVMHADQ